MEGLFFSLRGPGDKKLCPVIFNITRMKAPRAESGGVDHLRSSSFQGMELHSEQTRGLSCISHSGYCIRII